MSFADQIEKNLLDLYLGKRPMKGDFATYWTGEKDGGKVLRCHCGTARPEHRGVCYDCAVYNCHLKRYCPVDERSEQQIRDEFLELLHERP